MLDYLIEDNNLKPILKSLGNIDAQDILFIKEAIAGMYFKRDKIRQAILKELVPEKCVNLKIYFFQAPLMKLLDFQ